MTELLVMPVSTSHPNNRSSSSASVGERRFRYSAPLWAAWAGVVPSLGYILSVSGPYALGYLTIYRAGFLESGLMLESLVEGNMILVGILAFLWDPYNTIASFWFSLFG